MANGGIIGPVNTISTGGNKVTSTTGTGSTTITTQPGTRVIQSLVVAGGGGGGYNVGGGGGAGGFRCGEISVCGATSYPITVGAGGAGGTGYPSASSGNNSVFSTKKLIVRGSR